MLILKLFLSALAGVLMAELCIRLHIKDNLKNRMIEVVIIVFIVHIICALCDMLK